MSVAISKPRSLLLYVPELVLGLTAPLATMGAYAAPILHDEGASTISGAGSQTAAHYAQQIEHETRADEVARRNAMKRAKLAIEQGDWRGAARELEQAAALSTRDIKIQLALGELYNRLQRPQDAIAAAESALRIAPRSAAAYDIIGIAQRRQGDLDRAHAAFERAIELDPGSARGYLHLGELLLAEGNNTDAMMDPGLAAAYRDLARAYMRLGDLAAAERALRQIIGPGDSDPEALTLLGHIRSKDGDRAGAERAYRRAVAASPEFWPTRLTLGDLLATDGRCEEALGHYAAALDRARNKAPVDDAMARCAVILGDDTLAETHYRKALSQDASDAATLNGLAWLLARQHRSLKLALHLAERAARIEPKDPAIIDTLGWLYHLDGRDGIALRNLRVAAQALPHEPTVGYHLAAILAEQGQPEESAVLLQRALAGDDFPDRQAAQKLIDSLSVDGVRSAPD